MTTGDTPHLKNSYAIATQLPKSRYQELTDARTQLIAYIYSKIESGDWHAVQDAASDIREINAKISILNEQPH